MSIFHGRKIDKTRDTHCKNWEGLATCTHGCTCIPGKMSKKGDHESGVRIAKKKKKYIQRIISEFTGKNDRILSLLINNSVTCYRFVVIHFT